MSRKTLADLVDDVRFVAEELDEFLDPSQPTWGHFDPELGYIHRSIVWKDGVAGSFTQATYLPDGPRRGFAHQDQPCRINTYGDSFTEGACVNDGETWQERIAARIGEPVRNFGVGGYSSYQAYRLMKRTERGGYRAPYLLLNFLLDEDSLRNLDCFRWVRWQRWWNARKPDEKFRMVHANPGCHLRYEPARRGFVEVENPCPTPASLYRLVDRDFVFHLLEHDLSAQIRLAQQGDAIHDLALLRDCAESLDLPLTFSADGDCAEAAAALHLEIANRSAIHVADLWMSACAEAGRHGLIGVCYGQQCLIDLLEGRSASGVALVEHLRRKAVPTFDAGAAHRAAFAETRLSAEDFSATCYVNGHYSPRGNDAFAQGLVGTMLEVLDPKPALYDEEGALQLSLANSCGRNFALDRRRLSAAAQS